MARKHLDAVRRAAGKIVTARGQLADAMLAARDAEETVDDIAAAAGLKRSQTYELLSQAAARRQE